MNYLLLKYLHLSCVILSGSGFFLRGLLMLRSSPYLGHPVVRISPHIIDTALLGSAIAMSILSHQYPFTNDWLTAKLFGLLIYIVCGTMALKRARSKRQRTVYFGAALMAFAYIVSVALLRHPLGFARGFF
ncbi:MAG TPA: SirB2 family protein [Accumulibacter sp.]|nr:SirB2 family protein [Accumulibacter sp.]HMW17768.1 SirB2 family protein [Accumulibacter sp.]HMX22274.1 SirB2 family protein [Accumulibacter sp.]HMY05643.1 SirB2 family protein [Accumulibacter sp.]HNC17900.1 SirB2 family protein [Accumulibacter sp.]